MNAPAPSMHPPEEWQPRSPQLTLRDNEVHVWRASLDPPAETLARLCETLAPDERRRTERFYFPELRRRFAAGRGLLRAILAAYLHREPASLEFTYNAQAKPALAGAAAKGEVRFNLSHSHGLVLYAVTRGREVGVDVEHLRPEFAGEQIAERFFSPNETAALRALPPELRTEAFFCCWTRKEAYIKARGLGLALALDDFDVSLAPGAPAALLATRDDPRQATRWSLRALNPGPGYAGALAVEGRDWTLWCGQWTGP